MQAAKLLVGIPSGLMEYEMRFTQGKDGFVMVLSSFASIVQKGGETVKVNAGLGAFTLAGAFLGLEKEDVVMRRGVEEYDMASWWSAKTAAYINLRTKIKATLPSNDEDELAARCILSAELVAESLSFVGFLDQMADPFYSGAMPDDMHKPSGLVLVMAAAVSIACNPQLFGIAKGTANDRYAAHETRRLFKANQSHVIETADGDALFGIDIVINHAMTTLRLHIDALERDAHHGKDIAHMRAGMTTTLNVLYRAGIGLCIDICGPLPCATQPAYTEFGFARRAVDPLALSQNEACWKRGLGRLGGYNPPTRQTGRGARQVALLRVMRSVEVWIRSGTYMSKKLTEAADPIPMRTVYESVARQTNLPESLVPSHEVEAEGQLIRHRRVLRGSARKSGNRKGRQRKAQEQNAKAPTTATATATATATDPELEMCEKIDEAVKHNLCDGAVHSASVRLAEVLQMGVCYGLSDFNFSAFLVGGGAVARCARCPRQVTVMQGILFGGRYGRCRRCCRNLCLRCTTLAIGVAAASPGVCSSEAVCIECTSDKSG
jgi:hypothetical protein